MSDRPDRIETSVSRRALVVQVGAAAMLFGGGLSYGAPTTPETRPLILDYLASSLAP